MATCPKCNASISNLKHSLTFRSDVFLVGSKLIKDTEQTASEKYLCPLCTGNVCDTKREAKAFLEG